MPTDIALGIHTRKITWLYLLALSLIALLAITGQVFVQWALAELQDDASTINIAGRQRMLSQRIIATILAMESEQRSSADLSPRKEQWDHLEQALQVSLSTWSTNHNKLVSASRMVGADSYKTQDLFSDIQSDFDFIQKTARSVLASPGGVELPLLSSDARHNLIDHGDSFLRTMEAIVNQYEIESKTRVSKLQTIETSLLLATLIVLVCEGLFIFSPAIKSLRNAIQRLNSAAEQIKVSKHFAERANQAKTQFLAGVSHELRTPLHAILGMLELLRQSKLSPSQKTNVCLAMDASQSLRRLVDDLLDIARVENGEPALLNVERKDISHIASDCVRLMQPHIRKNEVVLEAISEIPVPAFYEIDEFRLRQIILNLLQNAIRYTVAGRIECHARVESNTDPSSDTEGDWLIIQVRDTGCGIEHNDLKRIFESFVRLNPRDGSRVLGQRLGLGLRLPHRLCRQ